MDTTAIMIMAQFGAVIKSLGQWIFGLAGTKRLAESFTLQVPNFEDRKTGLVLENLVDAK